MSFSKDSFDCDLDAAYEHTTYDTHAKIMEPTRHPTTLANGECRRRPQRIAHVGAVTGYFYYLQYTIS
jgi:hypothetical protein